MQTSYTIIYAVSFLHFLYWYSKVTSHMGVFLYSETPKLDPPPPQPLKKQKEDRTKTNKTGSSNNSSRSMFSPSFIEFGQPRFPRSDTLSQSGPLKCFQVNIFRKQVFRTFLSRLYQTFLDITVPLVREFEFQSDSQCFLLLIFFIIW